MATDNPNTIITTITKQLTHDLDVMLVINVFVLTHQINVLE